MDSDYAEADARNWVGAIMDGLRAEVEEQSQHQTQVTGEHDGFACLERTMRLLVRTRATTAE